VVFSEGHYGRDRPVSRTFAVPCGVPAFTVARADQGDLGEARSEPLAKAPLKGGEGPFSRAMALLTLGSAGRTLATAFDSPDRPAR
jgi:hypothetical protein